MIAPQLSQAGASVWKEANWSLRESVAEGAAAEAASRDETPMALVTAVGATAGLSSSVPGLPDNALPDKPPVAPKPRHRTAGRAGSGTRWRTRHRQDAGAD